MCVCVAVVFTVLSAVRRKYEKGITTFTSIQNHINTDNKHTENETTFTVVCVCASVSETINTYTTCMQINIKIWENFYSGLINIIVRFFFCVFISEQEVER